MRQYAKLHVTTIFVLSVVCSCWLWSTTTHSFQSTAADGARKFYSTTVTFSTRRVARRFVTITLDNPSSVAAIVLRSSNRNGDRNDEDERLHRPPRQITVRNPTRRTHLQRYWATTAATLLPISANAIPENTEKAVPRQAPTARNPTPLPSTSDAVYPRTFVGRWECRRVITAIKGDRTQAELTWRALGGGGGLGADDDNDSNGTSGHGVFSERDRTDVFDTNFLPTRGGSTAEGDGAVPDRGFELTSRLSQRGSGRDAAVVHWDALSPDTIRYEIGTRAIGGIDITVLQRTVTTDITTDRNGGTNGSVSFDELVRIVSDRGNGNRRASASAGIVSVVPFRPRVVRIRRRYRFSDDYQGNRRLEGFETVETYRMRNGVALMDGEVMSTTESRIRFAKPGGTR